MKTEEIFWYFFHLMSVILSSVIAYLVLKYIKKKPLGMQTLFDEIIKDTIYLNMLDTLVSSSMLVAGIFPTPLNHYVIRTIVICRHSISIAVICQLSILMLIRYLYVFYPTQINNAPFARNLARLLIVYISFTLSLFVDVKNLHIYLMLIGKNDHYNETRNGLDGSSQQLELSGTLTVPAPIQAAPK